MLRCRYKILNQAVKRNIERFPIEFRFQLSEIEKDEPVTKIYIKTLLN